MFKVNSKDTRTMSVTCSGVFIINFEHVIANWVNTGNIILESTNNW